jgi:hypothetical protein
MTSPASDEAKGTDRASSSSLASPSASASAATDRPKMSLPKDLTLAFDFGKPSDADSAAALEDAANYLRALNHAIARQDPTDPAYQYSPGSVGSR